MAVCLALPHAALADPDASAKQTPEYEAAFTRGRELFEAADFAGAREQFHIAYDIYPEPLLLFNIGSTYRREDDPERALIYYERFLADASPTDTLRPIATELVAELNATLTRRNLPPPDRQPAPPRPAPPPPAPDTDPHTYTVPVTAPDTPAPPRPGRSWRIAGIATTAAGTVALGIGIQQGLRARSISSDIENAEAGTEFTPELAARYDQGETAEARAIVFTATGIVAIGAGVALYVIGHRKARRHRRIAITPWHHPSTTGVALVGSF